MPSKVMFEPPENKKTKHDEDTGEKQVVNTGRPKCQEVGQTVACANDQRTAAMQAPDAVDGPNPATVQMDKAVLYECWDKPMDQILQQFRWIKLYCMNAGISRPTGTGLCPSTVVS